MAKLDVAVKIDLRKPQGKSGFGVPLILEENATTAKSYTECGDLSEVVTAGFGTGTKTYLAASLMFAQTHAPAKIAVCAATTDAVAFLNDAANTGKGWRQLVVVTNSETATNFQGISTAIEALKDKMYFLSLPTDSTQAIVSSGIERTLAFYYTATEDIPVPEAALVGEVAGQMPGSLTYKNLILSDLLPQNLTDPEINAIHQKGGVTFVTKAGDNVTSEGIVLGGEFADIVDSKDYVVQQIAYRTQKLLNNNSKIPLDNTGIAQLESVTVSVMQEAYAMGIIATAANGTPDYTVTYALRENVSAEDRAKRFYAGGTFSFALAGAVHGGLVTGEIII